MSNKPILTLSNICKDYRQGRSIIEVLKNVNLEVAAGEMVSIIGASGSGKSTLLHIAGMLDIAGSGIVTIDDNKFIANERIKNAHLIRLNKLGFIYQYHHLLNDFTAQENVAMPMLIAGAKREIAFAKAADLLSGLGLANRIYNVPGELSGGEQQRVAVARAIINDPKIILADEPTGNLDPAAADEVFDLFLTRARKNNMAVVMVTHNNELAGRMDKCYKLDYSLQKL